MKRIFLGIFMAVCAVSSCTTDEPIPRPYPRVNTLGVANISASGATFSGEIFYSNTPILDHGFLWSPYANVVSPSSDRISLGAKTGAGSFESVVARGLETGKTYYMRAYATSDGHVVYSDIEKFVAQGSASPVITDLSPAKLTWGDTLTLSGDHFSVLSFTNVVTINDIASEIIGGDENTLFIKVPYYVAKEFSDVTITMQGKVSKCPKQVQLKAPEIQSVSPSTGSEGMVVTISGLYLSASFATVYFNNVAAPLTNLTPNGVVVKVPAGLPAGNVEVKIVTGTGGLYDISTFKVL